MLHIYCILYIVASFVLSDIICIRHRWEGEMGTSQPHQAAAFRRGLDVVASSEISLSRCTQRFNIIASTMIEKIHIICIFSYEYRFETAKPSLTVKRIGENARWADLTIRLSVVKANSMSARKKYYSAVQNTVIACRCFIVFVTTC